MIVNGDNYKKLLLQLEDRGKSVDPDVLLPPDPKIRPGIGLIAIYHRQFQTVAIEFSWGVHIGQMILTLSAWYTLLSALTQDSEKTIKEFLQIFYIDTNILSPLQSSIIAVCVLSLLVFFTAFLRGKLSMFPDRLALDLNGIYHVSPRGWCHTSWPKIVSVEIVKIKVFSFEYGKLRFIRLVQANGDYLHLWVPSADRDSLFDLIQRLIIRHQPHNLQGRKTSNSNPV